MKPWRDGVISMLWIFALFAVCSANLLENDPNLGAPSYINIVEKVNLLSDAANKSVWADTPNETSYGYGTKYEPIHLNKPSMLLELPEENRTLRVVLMNSTDAEITTAATFSTSHLGFSTQTPAISNATENYSESSDKTNTGPTILNETVTVSSQVTTTVSSEQINHSKTSANGEETTTNTPEFLTTQTTPISTSPKVLVTTTQSSPPGASTLKASIPSTIRTSTENPSSTTDEINENSTNSIGENSTELQPNSINKYHPSTHLILVALTASIASITFLG